MEKCRVCGGADFYKEAGYYFCQTCQTQNEDIREEVLDIRIDNTTRIRKTRIRKLRPDRSGEELGWTSWELYNFVLIGLTNELIELGIPSEIKLTILQLWATYLGKIEVAFISRRKKCLPKLARRYKMRDAEIIYGKVQSQKKQRKRKRAASSINTSGISSGHSDGSTIRELNKNKKLMVNADYERYLQSQGSSDGDGLSLFSQSVYSAQSSSVQSSDNEGRVQFSSHAKEEARRIKQQSKKIPRSQRRKYREKHIGSQYKRGPHIVTPMRLWAIIYLALRIHHQPIQLGDMLRYAREGHLSYYKLDHLLPPEVSLTSKERSFLTQKVELTHKGMRRLVASMAKFLGVWNINCPDFLSLVHRYCRELGLPRGIQLYAERVIALSPPRMIFNSTKSHVPNYEGRAMGFIMVVLKVLFAMDGITEYQISRIAEKINSVAIDRGLLKEKLFSFHEWQRYMECKKTILVHAHFPTRMKHIPESDGIDDLYIKFFEFITSKSNGQESNVKNSKYYIPEELVNAMARHITSLNLDDAPSKTLDIFPPSLTPLHSYFQCLLEHPLYDIPIIARNDFFQTKVGYLTNLDSLVELGKRCGIELEVVDSNLHFLEKTVPPFEQPRMPSVEELKQTVVVQENTNKSCAAETGSLNDYLHAKVPCIVKFDVAKKQHYESIQSSSEDSETIGIVSGFGFTETLANGKLAIPASSDSESEEEEEEDSDFTSNSSKGTIKLGNKFCDKYNLCLSLAERDSIYKTDAVKSIRFKMPLVQLERNAKGQFVKGITTERRKGRNDPLATIENVNFSTGTRSSVISKAHSNSKAAASSGECDINISDVELDESCVRNNSLDLNDYCNLSDISFLDEFNEPEETKGNTARNEVRKFFRPFKDYWMYHCIFSRVKQKNFSVFEKELPRSFRWLLNECALIVEMSTRDLYEEVCLIETYHAQVLPSKNSRTASHGDTDSMPKNQLNFLLNKW